LINDCNARRDQQFQPASDQSSGHHRVQLGRTRRPEQGRGQQVERFSAALGAMTPAVRSQGTHTFPPRGSWGQPSRQPTSVGLMIILLLAVTIAVWIRPDDGADPSKVGDCMPEMHLADGV
jgi:hypothetical protein